MTTGQALSYLHTTKWTCNERIRQVAVVWMPPGRGMPEITSINEVKPAPNPAGRGR